MLKALLIAASVAFVAAFSCNTSWAGDVQKCFFTSANNVQYCLVPTFDSNHRRLKDSISYFVGAAGWKLILLNEKEYDANGNMTMRQQSGKINGAWRHLNRTVSTFNSNNQITGEFSYITFTDTLELRETKLYWYNSAGSVDSTLESKFSVDRILPTCKWEFVYAPNGRKLKEIKSDFDGTKMVVTAIINFEYDEAGNMVRSKGNEVNGGEQVPSTLIEYTYDANRNITSFSGYMFIDGVQEKYVKYAEEFDEQSRIISHTDYRVNTIENEWLASVRFDTHYNPDGRVDSVKSFDLNTSTGVPELYGIRVMSYNESGLLLQKYQYLKIDTCMKLDHGFEYTYSGNLMTSNTSYAWLDDGTKGLVNCDTISASDSFGNTYTYGSIAKIELVYNDTPISASDVQSNNTYEVFPCPASDYLSVRAGSSDQMGASARFRIFNLAGECLSDFVSAIDASGNCRINVSHLLPGMYFLEIDGKSYGFIKN